MSLINCPECRKEISDQAKKCINCGYPIKSFQQDSTLHQKKSNKKFGIIVISIIAVFIIIMLLRGYYGNDDKELSKQNTEKLIGDWEMEYQEYNILELNPESDYDVTLGEVGEYTYYKNGTYKSEGIFVVKLPAYLDSHIFKLKGIEQGTWQIKGDILVEETKSGSLEPYDTLTEKLLNSTFSYMKEDFQDVGIGEETEYNILTLDENQLIIEHELQEFDVKIKYTMNKK